MAADSAFANRLRKNQKRLRRWAERQGLTAYRLYDRDLPEVPFVVELFADRVHLVEFPRRGKEAPEPLRAEVMEAVQLVLEVPPERIFPKTHLPMPWGREQYGLHAAGVSGERFEVKENGLRFLVNLTDHLDTGLFLDHRDTRARVRADSAGKRVLNLFAYTGSFSVYAAAGGAQATTTVDLSNTYLDWAADNLALNGFSGAAHQLLRSDVTRWMGQSVDARERYDVIVLDPPSFSASKAMSASFNVQRDQVKLLRAALELLDHRGILYFSTNFRGFALTPAKVPAHFEELTPRSLPEDFHDRAIHRCWRVTHAGNVPQLKHVKRGA